MMPSMGKAAMDVATARRTDAALARLGLGSSPRLANLKISNLSRDRFLVSSSTVPHHTHATRHSLPSPALRVPARAAATTYNRASSSKHDTPGSHRIHINHSQRAFIEAWKRSNFFTSAAVTDLRACRARSTPVAMVSAARASERAECGVARLGK